MVTRWQNLELRHNLAQSGLTARKTLILGISCEIRYLLGQHI